jgi:predicted nucleic acid-binding protein
MSDPKRIVLDANVLLRGAFGLRVRNLLASYQETVAFYTPDLCVEEALRHAPKIAKGRNIDPEHSRTYLSQLFQTCINVVDRTLYEEFETRAQARISSRDPDDWPIVATAMLLDAPIWTEDQDFFGTGVATWTSNKIEIYLRDS